MILPVLASSAPKETRSHDEYSRDGAVGRAPVSREEDGLKTIQCLNLYLLVNGQNHRFVGKGQIQRYNVASLLNEQGIL